MLRLLLMAAIAVAFVSSDQNDNKVDIGATVKEVEAMLAKDPRLPRLTRGEILKLIDEVRTGKDVVVVLPDNQSPLLENAQSTTMKPRRPVKRRRKKPTTVRPVYVHSTTHGPSDVVSSTSGSTSPEPATKSSTTQQAEWTPYSTTKSPVKVVPVTPTPDSKLSGGLPPVPGLSMVEDINSWSASSTSGPAKDMYITPVPPVASSSPPPTGDPEGPPNVKVAAESLGPEMKDLLTKFGLLGDESSTTEKLTFQSDLPAPTIDPEVYSRFKPLPVKSSSDFVSPDMKSLLASYGLLDTPRQGKDLKGENSRGSETPLDYIPEREKSVLSALGLWRDGKAIDPTGSPKNLPKHVFKPKKVDPSSSKEELEKVTKILSKIREIGEGDESQMTELSPSDVEELLLLENNTRLTAQDELDLSEESDSSEEKNEIKRNPQESGASSSASASAAAVSTASASGSASSSSDAGSSAGAAASADGGGDDLTTTTEAATTTESTSSTSDDTTERGASAVDLAESFGGGDTVSTTTRRPNGFYFLLDWNSFFDLGLDDRAIHLNFSPKVGNPANFLPVEIGKSGTPGSR